ncbi:Gamma-glutamyltransferase 7 [Armadillidium nasatum]|uniref:Gamma-glutamyltransferase 7 n=1 Tax=Armadillidium nasatum TaxID=96803 RepID=A0A5N5SJ45_9CRUS|nr:Gamma-glutamyltransferase 7 [Armadillidium nasatum]
MVVYNRHGISESTSLQSPGTPQSFWKKRCCHAGNSDGFTVISSCFFVFTIAVTGSLIIQIHFGTGEVTPHGAVASDDQTCSEIGIHTIRDGGSAADAAIATLLCLSVTQPHWWCVVLIHDHKLNESKILDFMVLHKTGNSTTGVPGFLKGLERLHKLYGKLPFKDLIHPAIKLAREGFIASKQLVDALRKVDFNLVNLNFQNEFFPKGIMIKENQVLVRKNYAKFLEAVSIGGADEIHLLKYRTEMMEAFDALRSDVTIDDLLDYEIIERKLVRERLFNVTISTVGPPFGGLQVIAVQPDSDILNETSTLMTKLTSHGFSLSDLPHPTVPESVASQVSVIDTFDLYVSIIVGLGDSFGSKYMTEHGVILNRDSENANRGGAMFDGRHISSFTPLTISDTNNICGDRVVLASGSWGALLQTCAQLIFRNLDMISAIAQPRITLGTEPKVLLLNDFNKQVEKLPPEVREYLKNEEHFKLSGLFTPLVVNGVSKSKDVIVSHSDPRGGGIAARLEEKVGNFNETDL